MKTEKMYNLVKAWSEDVQKSECRIWHEQMLAEMKKAMSELEVDMLAELSKKAGTKSITAAAMRIIKNAQKANPARAALHGMFCNKLSDWEDRWLVSDGYHAVRFKDKLPLPEIPEKMRGHEIDFTKIIKIPENPACIDVAPLSEIKLFAKTHKAKKNEPIVPYCMSRDFDIWCNAEYLANILECLPDCKVYINANSNVAMIYFQADNGDGLLCPVRHKEEA